MRTFQKVKFLAVLSAAGSVLPAFATTGFDTTSVVAVITDVTGAVGLVAAAVFGGPIIIAKAWRWLRGAA